MGFDAFLLSTACWSMHLMQPWSYRQALWHGHLRVQGLKDFLCVCVQILTSTPRLYVMGEGMAFIPQEAG